MGEPITITLRGLPVGKGRPRFSRSTGRVYTPGKTADYEGGLAGAASRVMGDAAPLEGPLAVSVIAVFPIPASWSGKKKAKAAAGLIRPTGKPDGDNLLKACGDGLNAIVWRDDSQIVDARIRKVYGASPAMIIRVVAVDLTGSEAA